MIHRVAIGMDDSRATISIVHWKNEYETTVIVYTFYGDMLKKGLLHKLLSIEGIVINELEIYFFECALEISESMVELIERLAPINITKSGRMKKATREYLDGVMELEKFEQEVIAYCVAEKLSN